MNADDDGVTSLLKQELWKRYGDRNYPAEWDGWICGGGKISQRFWEYFRSLELLRLNKSSVLLDIGGGSPQTGMGFFTGVVQKHIKGVIVMDVNVPRGLERTENVDFVPEYGGYDSLMRVFKARPDITHVSCISVFEHIEDAVREGIVRAINDGFHGELFVSTLEFHVKKVFFGMQLTVESLGRLFMPMKNFYLDTLDACPMHAQNAFLGGNVLMPAGQTPQGGINVSIREDYTPLWYPLALRFVRMAT